MIMGSEALHVALLPWLAFGHLIPFLHLAIALANAGLRVSFLSTPRNIRRLPDLPTHDLITFVDLPLPPVDGLPDHAESTLDLSPDEIPLLKSAYDLLQTPIRRFIAEESPDWVIHDFLPYWIPAIARESGVPSVYFSVFAAASMAFCGPAEAMTEDGIRRWWASPENLMSTPEWIPFPSTLALRRREAEVFHSAVFSVNASGVRDTERLRLTVEGCKAVAVRSCNEYEAEYLELLGTLYRKPVIPIGLLPPPLPVEIQRAAAGDGWNRTIRWIDEQEAKSVVFVSFGSEYKMTRPEVHELAHGLELSGIPFLWVLRRPGWVTGGDDEALPEGFRSRNEGRGVVSFGWAPQVEVLAHPAVGGMLFHSGWGSTVEALRHGHVLVVMPAVYDQGLQARVLVEKGLAIEVERDGDGSFGRDGIATAVRAAMVSGGGGEAVRMKAKEMSAVVADQGLHDKYVKEFVDYLREARKDHSVALSEVAT